MVYTWTGPNHPDEVQLKHQQIRWCNAQAHSDPKTMPPQPTAHAHGYATDGDSQHAVTADRYSTDPGTTDVSGTVVFGGFGAEGSVETVLPYVQGAGNVHETEKSWRVVE